MKTTSIVTLTAGLILSSSAMAQAITGSIATKDKAKKDYPTLATVSLQDAVGAALTKVPGKAVDAELDSEKGFLVYEVKVITAENVTHELLIDAGNQTVLRDEVKKGVFK